jgi:polyisoprenoid-binding protein YceI
MKYLLIALMLEVFTQPAFGVDCWTPVPEGSKIAFSVSQAGAELQGSFKNFTGSVCMDPADAGKDRLRVEVDLASVDTQLPELDEALRGGDFFEVKRWPHATFESESVKALGGGRYQVTGKLTIRDVTRSISVPFTWTPAADGKSAKLEGQLSLQRLDYKIGQGQWADTQWVGSQVDLTFTAAFKPAPATAAK